MWLYDVSYADAMSIALFKDSRGAELGESDALHAQDEDLTLGDHAEMYYLALQLDVRELCNSALAGIEEAINSAEQVSIAHVLQELNLYYDSLVRKPYDMPPPFPEDEFGSDNEGSDEEADDEEGLIGGRIIYEMLVRNVDRWKEQKDELSGEELAHLQSLIHQMWNWDPYGELRDLNSGEEDSDEVDGSQDGDEEMEEESMEEDDDVQDGEEELDDESMTEDDETDGGSLYADESEYDADGEEMADG